MELFIDNFAGGGGASTGIEMATGRSVDIAINHDPAAIAMHMANHPETEHHQEDVWQVDPREVCKGRPVGLAWFSPDCTHHSKALGGKPRKKNIRGLAWVAVRWAIAVKPRVIMLENVEEFQDWGPLDDKGFPIKGLAGQTFQSFVDSLKSLGYQVEWRELRACDYGAPTIRKRLFLVARCDGKPIRWPKPTHGDPNSLEVQIGKLKPWRTTAEIIDWSIPCPSIFDTSKQIKEKYGIKVVRPLAKNTQARIARGMFKFVIDDPNPFIVRIGQTGFGGDRLQYSLDQPLTTITTKAEHCLIVPLLTSYNSETRLGEVRGLEVDGPLHTLDTSNRFGLVTAFISQQYKSSTGHSLDQALGAITTVNKASLVTAFLIKYYGSDLGQRINEPLHTITTKDRFGLVKVRGELHQIADIGFRMLQPHELYAAQGFPPEYIIDRDHEGNPITKTDQVKMCGNSVSPVLPKAMVKVNLPELCIGSGKQLVFERYRQDKRQLQFSM